MTKEQWLEREGFNPTTGRTYIYAGDDSYQIKERLKSLGFRFNSNILWHIANPEVLTDQYLLKTIPVHYSEVLEIMAWGEGRYYADAAQKIKAKIVKVLPPSASNYITPDEDGKIRVYAECVSKNQIETMFGLTNVYIFKADEDEIVWYSKTNTIEVGDIGNITATFKKHSDYRGHKQTTVSRLKMEN